MHPQDVPSWSQPTAIATASRLLRIGEVQRRTGLPRNTIYRLLAAGKFPRQIRLTEATSAWVDVEVQAWIDSRIAASRGQS